MKDVVGEKRHEQEAFDGAGRMFENVIGVPFVDQFVEAIILDIPTLWPRRTTRSVETCDDSVVTQIQSLVWIESFLSICRRTEQVSRERTTRTGAFTWGHELDFIPQAA